MKILLSLLFYFHFTIYLSAWQTPLHHAASIGSTEIVRELVKFGAELDPLDVSGIVGSDYVIEMRDEVDYRCTNVVLNHLPLQSEVRI